MLASRAALLTQLRRFFDQRQVMEVETPLLCPTTATDPHLDSMVVDQVVNGDPRRHYLQTSPEFAMKKLLAAGSGPIFQVCKAFRRDERSRRHNPEFTMLEWYRLGFDHFALMDEVHALLRELLPALAGNAETITYAQAFKRHAGLDPHDAPLARLRDAAGPDAPDLGDDRDGWLDLIMSTRVAAKLGVRGVVHVHGFPQSQAALARILPGTPPVAARFESWVAGLELANGYHELTDAAELRQRFERENARRVAGGGVALPLDDALLNATRAGIPDCAGVAMGFDRVVMLAAGLDDVRKTLAFPYADA